MNSPKCGSSNNSGSVFVIDNDAGADDAIAIFMALINEKYNNGPKLIALTTVNGNTAEENVYVNNQKILSIAKRQDVPIYRGTKRSLVNTPKITDYFGKDGLGDTDDIYTDLVPARKEGAVSTLIELSKSYEGNLTVITIGSLTNLALAIKIDPDFLGRLKHLYVAAGHIHSDMQPDAEFNAHMDVEAYNILTQNATPDKVTMIPFSQIHDSLDISREWRENVLGVINTDIIKALNKFERISIQYSDRWHALDPAAIAVFLRPDLVEEYKFSNNSIILCGDKRGINTNDFVEKEKSNTRIVHSFKIEEYKKFLFEIFSHDA